MLKTVLTVAKVKHATSHRNKHGFLAWRFLFQTFWNWCSHIVSFLHQYFLLNDRLGAHSDDVVPRSVDYSRPEPCMTPQKVCLVSLFYGSVSGNIYIDYSIFYDFCKIFEKYCTLLQVVVKICNQCRKYMQ